MSNEILNQILSELKDIKTDVSSLKAGQLRLEADVATLKTDVSDLKAGQRRIEQKLDTVYEQTAVLTEFKIETTTTLDSINNNIHKLSSDFVIVEAVTGKNMQD